MASKVEHGAAASFGFLDKPVARVSGLGIEPLEGIDLDYHGPADLAGSNDFLDAVDGRIKMAVIRHTEFNVMVSTGGIHPVALFDIQGHWFFAENMFAGFCGRDGLGDVDINRRRDV